LLEQPFPGNGFAENGTGASAGGGFWSGQFL
jgi:hypothetical protein